METLENENKSIIKKAKFNFTNITLIVVCILTVINTFLIILNFHGPKRIRSTKEIFQEDKKIGAYGRQVAKKCINVPSITISKDEYSTHAIGRIKNSSKKALIDVQVVFICYDEEGNFLGVDSGYISYLPAKETYKFDTYVEDDTEKVEIINMIAYYYDDVN